MSDSKPGIEGRELFRIATEVGWDLFIAAFQQAIYDERADERERCAQIVEAMVARIRSGEE